jgi:hypothetical protein
MSSWHPFSGIGSDELTHTLLVKHVQKLSIIKSHRTATAVLKEWECGLFEGDRSVFRRI